MTALLLFLSTSGHTAPRKVDIDHRSVRYQLEQLSRALFPLGEQTKSETRDAARQRVADRISQRRGGAPAAANGVSPETLAYSALCQALFLSGEFRTVD